MKNSFNACLKLIVIIIIITQYSCQKDNFKGEIIGDPSFIENLYTNSLDTVIIDNQNLILETEMYRDFFPGGPINNNNMGLYAPIYMVNIDSNVISQNFTVSKLYIINNNQAWVSEPETRPENAVPVHKTFMISTNGPEWDTGIYVDVIIEIMNLINNKKEFLIARNQIIIKVE